MTDAPISLALSATGGNCAVAVRTADGKVHEAPTPTDTRGDTLATQVEAAFARAGIAPDAIGEVRLDLGPGSYTGLRIAVTFARVVSSFLEVPVWTVTSPQLLALAAWSSGTLAKNARVRPILDARRGRYHHALVQLLGTTRLVEPPRAVPLEELLQRIGRGEALLAEPDLHPLLQETAAREGAVCMVPVPFGAGLLFHEQVELVPKLAHELEPLYLMGSYAEEPT